jgi:hypothetical protein
VGSGTRNGGGGGEVAAGGQLFENSQIIAQAMKLQAMKLHPLQLAKKFSAKEVASVNALGHYLVNRTEDIGLYQTLTKDVHYLTGLDRHDELFVHIMGQDNVIVTTVPGAMLKCEMVANAQYLIVGPLDLTGEVMASATIVPDTRIELEDHELEGKPVSLTFAMTGSRYGLTDGYSITYCVKLPESVELELK